MKNQTKEYLKDQKHIDFTGDIKYYFASYWDGRKSDETHIEELTEYLLCHEGRKRYATVIRNQAERIFREIQETEKS